jgi:hypothetical protein
MRLLRSGRTRPHEFGSAQSYTAGDGSGSTPNTCSFGSGTNSEPDTTACAAAKAALVKAKARLKKLRQTDAAKHAKAKAKKQVKRDESRVKTACAV